MAPEGSVTTNRNPNMTELDLMLHTLSALDAPIFTYTGICPVCLVKTEYHTRTRPDFTEATVVCRGCSKEMDAPVYEYNARVY
jgi:hypothetical protein